MSDLQDLIEEAHRKEPSLDRDAFSAGYTAALLKIGEEFIHEEGELPRTYGGPIKTLDNIHDLTLQAKELADE